MVFSLLSGLKWSIISRKGFHGPSLLQQDELVAPIETVSIEGLNFRLGIYNKLRKQSKVKNLTLKALENTIHQLSMVHIFSIRPKVRAIRAI